MFNRKNKKQKKKVENWGKVKVLIRTLKRKMDSGLYYFTNACFYAFTSDIGFFYYKLEEEHPI